MLIGNNSDFLEISNFKFRMSISIPDENLIPKPRFVFFYIYFVRKTTCLFTISRITLVHIRVNNSIQLNYS